MSNIFTFLRIYKDIANNRSNLHEVQYLYKELANQVPEDLFNQWFAKADPSPLDMAISVDAVAHKIHDNGNDTLQQIYPEADYEIVKSTLDSLAGLEKSNDIRKLNRGFFTTLLSEDGFVFLEKQIARTIKEDILEAVKEYEKLFKAGIASKAEILTLSRFYPENKLYQDKIIELGLDREDNEPMVIGGPASVEMVDKEGHLITVGALKDAFEKFMDSFRTRNANLFHSDVQCGWILPAYINRQGEVFKSGVDDKGLWVISEIRDDNTIAKKVAEGIENGELRSYSIAGSATKTTPMQKGAQTYTEVSEMNLQEITLCLTGNSQVWTGDGLKFIKDIIIGDEVYTHKNRWCKVIKTMQREIHEEIIELTTEHGSISLTKEHPVRTMQYLGRQLGSKYCWVEAENLKTGDIVSAHFSTGKCSNCNIPLFKKLYSKQSFCSNKCHNLSEGNRKGKTIVSGDLGAISHSQKTKGITKKENPRLSGGIKTIEGKLKQLAGVTSESFRKKRSIFQKQLCQDPEYMLSIRRKGVYRKGYSFTKAEKRFFEFAALKWPNVWKFVGDWKLIIGKKCPDFHDGKNKLIEIYGDFWHKGENPQERIDYFKKYGYDCLIIWASELQKTEELEDRINEFMGNSFSKILNVGKYLYDGFVYNLEIENDNSYTTVAGVVHNCSKGMNQGAHFDILKSDNTLIDSFDDKALDNALMKLSDDNLYLDDFGVYADAGRNTIWITASDQIAHILKAMLAEYDNMTVSITDFIPPDAKPLYKFHVVPIWKENIVLEESKKNIDDKIQWLKKINGGNGLEKFLMFIKNI